MNDRQGKPRGSGFIRFNNVENATKALETLKDTQTPKGETLDLAYARDPNRRKLASAPTSRLNYLGCSSNILEIMTIFQQFSESIMEVNTCMLFTLSNSVPRSLTELHCIVKNPDGERLDSGFIRFKDTENAKKALEALNGTQTPKGEIIVLSYAKRKPGKTQHKKSKPVAKPVINPIDPAFI